MADLVVTAGIDATKAKDGFRGMVDDARSAEAQFKKLKGPYDPAGNIDASKKMIAGMSGSDDRNAWAKIRADRQAQADILQRDQEAQAAARQAAAERQAKRDIDIAQKRWLDLGWAQLEGQRMQRQWAAEEAQYARQQQIMNRVMANEFVPTTRGSRAGWRDNFGGAADGMSQLGQMSGAARSRMSNAMFMAQDFAAVLQGGGANSLSRAAIGASNNIGAMAAGMGPWGMAMVTGAAILTPLIAKLIETGFAAEKAESGFEKMKTLRDVIRDVQDFGQEFNTSFRKMSSVKDFESALAANRDAIERQNVTIKRAIKDRNRMFDELKEKASFENEFGNPIENAEEFGRAMPNTLKGQKLSLWDNVDDVKAQSQKVRDAAIEVNGEREKANQLLEQKWQLERAMQDANSRENDKRLEDGILDAQQKQLENDKQRFEVLQKQAESIKEMNRTPVEKFKDSMQNLVNLRTGRLIDDTTFTREARRLRDEAQKAPGSGTRGENNAFVRNSKEALEEALKTRDEPAIEQQKETNATMKEAVKKLSVISNDIRRLLNDSLGVNP